MIKDFTFKDRYDINDLLEIMTALRSPGGCPWDAEQDHKSIRKDFIEETYEAIEAIDNDDPVLLQEELGDVLLQVVFHSEIEREKGVFDFSDVADGICKKLIERHPHVFGDVRVNGSDEVLVNWDRIKQRTKGQKKQSDSMLSVPKQFPALMRAQKIQHKAAKVGFDWDDVSGALERLESEISELKQAIKNGGAQEQSDELGDVLFSAVNVARFIGAESEKALSDSTDKFLNRFIIVERLAREAGRDMTDMTLAELDELWDRAKLEAGTPQR
ncbi:MAG: nucleoside triphosphate pyrophosphohydrolase [Clostridia bacterium]|nr:nucleoside triphosphate pyrophosphohydrolase [Clostridia bacterium]